MVSAQGFEGSYREQSGSAQQLLESGVPVVANRARGNEYGWVGE